MLNPIEHGKPRAPSIERVPVPKVGLSAHNATSGKFIHALGHINAVNGKSATAPLQHRQAADRTPIKPNAIRISGALGEVSLNVHKATHGLAHGPVMTGVRHSSGRNSPTGDTVWSDGKASASRAGGFGQDSANSGNTTAAASGGAATTSGSTAAAVTVPANGNGNGKDNGNGATGNGKGNNGNGNGNGGGNGNGQGKNK